MEDLFIEGKSLLYRSTESSEFGISTGITHRKQEFGEEELVEDLFREEKSMLDRSTESS